MSSSNLGTKGQSQNNLGGVHHHHHHHKQAVVTNLGEAVVAAAAVGRMQVLILDGGLAETPEVGKPLRSKAGGITEMTAIGEVPRDGETQMKRTMAMTMVMAGAQVAMPKLTPGAQKKGRTNSMWSADKSVPSTYSMPSKTLSHAYKGTTSNLYPGIVPNHKFADAELIESKGEAIMVAESALFGRTRSAKDRIHWMFPSEKDERVVSLLFWIQSMEHAIGTWGVRT